MPPFNRSREAILRALSEGQVRSTDRRAVFVGASAYEKAGGVIVRDLFDAEGGGFFADAELLNRLAAEKLQAVADEIKAEAGVGSSAAISLRLARSNCARRRPSPTLTR